MLATPTLRFDSVCVIESLGDPDPVRHTGTWLVENVLKAAARDQSLKIFHAVPAGRVEFFEALAQIRDVIVARGHGPIIHLETHGDKDGISLASGEMVEWRELTDILTAINHAVGFNLLLVLAMCCGYYFIQTLVPTRPSPVWALVGPAERVWDGDLRKGMGAFYTELLSSLDGGAAVRALNSHKPPRECEYRFEPADFILCRVFRRYLEDWCNPPQLQDRENEIVAEILRRRQYDLNVAMLARHDARIMLRDHAKYFEHLKHNFFMLEHLPRNGARFPIAFNDCGGADPVSSR